MMTDRPTNSKMTNSEDYASYGLAAKLKAAGFDRECNPANPYCIAIPLWKAQKWLRETKGIAINVIAHDGGKYEYDIVFLPYAAETDNTTDRSPLCRTYEEALSAGIDAALGLVGRK